MLWSYVAIHPWDKTDNNTQKNYNEYHRLMTAYSISILLFHKKIQIEYKKKNA